MALPTRPLGSSGFNITTIGYGSWAVGGSGWPFSWGPQDDSESIATMRHALELGINWIDTAAVYGLGHSEEIVGKLLRDLPFSERPLVFTKCGLIWDDHSPLQPAKRVLIPASIRRECEISLRRLGVEQIDLYQFHWPNNCGTPIEDAWAEMALLINEGKVRAAGVSNFDVALLERCEALHHVESLQPPFSLINRAAGEREIPWCKNHNTGVICYSPMQSGLLTDGFSASRIAQMAGEDWRRKAVDFLEPKLSRNLALRDALRPIARRHSTSISSVAIAWTLYWPGLTGAIVGARTPAQVDGWIQGAALQLTPEDQSEITAAIARTQAGAGPAHPPKSASTSTTR